MTKRCAHIDLARNVVANIIIADPAIDQPWPGHILVADPPAHVKIGTPWLGDGFEPAPTSKPEVPDGVESL